MIEVTFIIVYAIIIALVTPYIIGTSQYHGILVPAAVSLVWGEVIFSALNWLGMGYQNVWLWIITMFTMPVVMYLVVYRLRHVRVRNTSLNEKADAHIREHGGVKELFKFAARRPAAVKADEAEIYDTSKA